MKKIIIALLAVVVFTACEEKDIRLYPTIEESLEYTIDGQGDFSESEYLKSSEILSAVNDLDFGEDGQIEDVTIEGIWIVVKKLPKNTAESVTMDLSIEIAGVEKELLNNYMFQVPAEEKTFYISGDLIKAGVVALSNEMRSIIIDKMVSGDVEFNIEGTTMPADSKINMEVEVFVKQGLVIKETVKMI
ncbi:hypothetical protein [Labilibacter marinus]|uniref:hypothetical protein n=1 Tax=Labilibacter marinus TaxID=1477105 RepID=UPI00117ABAF6|nr:hypothetical protein [Labilibacter marinus]